METLVILTKTPVAELTTYQSLEDGQVLRIDAAMGITMLREPREKAMGIQPAEYRPPQDFAILTSVRSNVDLPSTGKLRRLHIRLIGLPDETFVLEDSRQRVLERGRRTGPARRLCSSARNPSILPGPGRCRWKTTPSGRG